MESCSKLSQKWDFSNVKITHIRFHQQEKSISSTWTWIYKPQFYFAAAKPMDFPQPKVWILKENQIFLARHCMGNEQRYPLNALEFRDMWTSFLRLIHLLFIGFYWYLQKPVWSCMWWIHISKRFKIHFIYTAQNIYIYTHNVGSWLV